MRLILNESVSTLGEIGDEVNVKAGYARNFLLPKGLAMVANKSNVKVVEHQKRRLNKKKQEQLSNAQKLSGTISQVSVTVTKQVGENEKIFGSVTTAELEGLLANEGVKVDKRNIHLKTEIKKVGVYVAEVRLHPEVTAEFKVWVVAQVD